MIKKMGWFKKYIAVVLLINAISLIKVPDRRTYLRQYNPISSVKHLLLPSVAHKTEHGYYAVMCGFAALENFIKENMRGKGHGMEQNKEIIQKYSVYILNKRTYPTYERLMEEYVYSYWGFKKLKLIIKRSAKKPK
jgi:hypothetical protein